MDSAGWRLRRTRLCGLLYRLICRRGRFEPSEGEEARQGAPPRITALLQSTVHARRTCGLRCGCRLNLRLGTPAVRGKGQLGEIGSPVIVLPAEPGLVLEAPMDFDQRCRWASCRPR